MPRKCLEERKVLNWKAVNEFVKRINFPGRIACELGHFNKVFATLRGEDVAGKFAEVELEEAGDCMDVKVLVLTEEIVVRFWFM